MRTALEQELGLAAYFVSNEVSLEKAARNEPLESDAEKLSSTDNEDEELVTEGERWWVCSPLFFPGGAAWTRPDGCDPQAPGDAQQLRQELSGYVFGKDDESIVEF